MECGFETIGNATLIFHDEGRPVLATDPWITPNAYFGSWTLSHEIPNEQLSSILGADYIWFSHGHPDHLNPDSVERLRGKRILLPDHRGGRIARDLRALGHDVVVLEDRKWIQLSKRIRVMCVSDYNQDAVLLVDVNRRLVINLNDADDHGWAAFVRRQAREFDISFLLAISGFGDADMINFFDQQGNRTVPSMVGRYPAGYRLATLANYFGATYVIPFSSLHKYQRQDSIWANAHIATVADYKIGFAAKRARLLAAFIRYDCMTDRHSEINPRENSLAVLEPEAFGDHWVDPLERNEVVAVERYFKAIEHLSTFLDHVTVRIGGKEHAVNLSHRKTARGIIFEAPRHSFMTAIQYEIFDDLMIGNFMKTTLIGDWTQSPTTPLYPDFSPFVAKYADNGGAKSEKELGDYFGHYRNRAPAEFFAHRAIAVAMRTFRSWVPRGSLLDRTVKSAYYRVRNR